MVELSSERLTVQIEAHGAQLLSIRDRHGEEYLWQGNPAVWARRAPILFPFIGRLKDGQYLLDGAPYHISSHGFARDLIFSLHQVSGTQVRFHLTDTEETRRCYPFSFSLTVTYTLVENRLLKTHQIENHSSRTMYYELGGHDGFLTPDPLANCRIRLPGLRTLRPYGMDADAMLTPQGPEYPLEDGKVAPTPASYGLDTIIVDRLPRRRAELLDGRGRVRVALDFHQFPYLGLWTANSPSDPGYVCIEPWTSLPAMDGVVDDFETKKFMTTLESMEIYLNEWSITLE